MVRMEATEKKPRWRGEKGSLQRGGRVIAATINNGGVV